MATFLARPPIVTYNIRAKDSGFSGENQEPESHSECCHRTTKLSGFPNSAIEANRGLQMPRDMLQ